MKPLLTASLLSLLPMAALSQAPAAALRQMLDLVPRVTDGGPVQVEFGDLAAARAQPSGAIPEATADPALTQLRALERSALGQAIRNPATDWRGAVGFGPAQIDRVVTLTAPPLSAMVIQVQPGAGAGVPPALAERGYALTQGPGLTAWARGGQDFALDIAARDPDDPSGGGMGRSSRIVVADDLIRQAAAWPVLAALLAAPGASMADQPEVAALLAALDRIKGAGALVSALILTDAGGGLWVLAIRARAPSVTIGPGIPRNPVTMRLHDAMIRRDLVILQP